MKQKSFIVGAAAFWVVMCTNYFIKLGCMSKTSLSYCEVITKDLQTVCKRQSHYSFKDDSKHTCLKQMDNLPWVVITIIHTLFVHNLKVQQCSFFTLLDAEVMYCGI